MKVSDAERTLLWQKSYAMSRAHYVFAPKDVRAQLRELERGTGWSTTFEELRRAADSHDLPTSGPERISAILGKLSQSPAAANSQALRTLKEQLRSSMLEHLERGDLLSFGFEPREHGSGARRSIHDVPIELSYEHWCGSVLWDRNELKAHSLKFIEVRLLPLAWAEKVLRDRVAELAEATPPPKLGRPSATDDIVAACEALKAAGKIDTSSSIKSHIPIVRAWLRENRPNAPHVGDETIRRVLSPLYHALEKAQKK